MTELSYMIHKDWAQRGTAKLQSSALIRDWLGDAPYFFAVTDTKKLNRDGRGADLEAAELIAPEAKSRRVLDIEELGQVRRTQGAIEKAIVVLYPFEEHDSEILRELVADGKLMRVFVLIWSGDDIIRTWLDGLGATNLHTGQPTPPPDRLLVEAAMSMVGEQYNGLSSGRGKDAVVQLIRAFSGHGYALDSEAWLRAFFAAGGEFRHAQSVRKLIQEMKSGVKHRVKPAYRDEIFDILRGRIIEPAAGAEH